MKRALAYEPRLALEKSAYKKRYGIVACFEKATKTWLISQIGCACAMCISTVKAYTYSEVDSFLHLWHGCCGDTSLCNVWLRSFQRVLQVQKMMGLTGQSVRLRRCGKLFTLLIVVSVFSGIAQAEDMTGINDLAKSS